MPSLFRSSARKGRLFSSYFIFLLLLAGCQAKLNDSILVSNESLEADIRVHIREKGPKTKVKPIVYVTDGTVSLTNK